MRLYVKQILKTFRYDFFTIVELLLVITIIVILASLLLPALGMAREKARSIVCNSNLSQIGKYVSLYTDDNNLFLMLAATDKGYPWNNFLEDGLRYKGKIFMCPSNAYKYGYGDCDGLKDYVDVNYVYSYYSREQRITTLRHSPSSQSIVADGANDKGKWTYVYYATLSVDPIYWHQIKALHQKRANILWLDGHVDKKTTAEIQKNSSTWVSW